MKTDREKLIKLIHHCTSCEECHDSDIADHLIANGVTVQEDCEACAEKMQKCIEGLQEQIAEMQKKQEWISVEDRMPEAHKVVLCIGVRGGMFLGYHCYTRERCAEKSECFHVPNARHGRYATHWMPLPEPLKEG